MSNRGQVWDHKSLLKPKSFSKSPLDRILVPDYKFMVAIIDRIVSCSIFRKICIFQEKIQSYSYQPQFVQIFSLMPTHFYRQPAENNMDNKKGLRMMWIKLYCWLLMFSRKKLWNQPDETKWDNRFFLLFGPFRDTISPIIILQSMIRDNHKTWFRHIYDSLLSYFWRFSTIMILLTENWWQIVDKRSKDQETLEILREKSQTFLGTASNRFSCVF